MKKYKLEIIVFICGAVVMILELVGSRVLAPYVGTSIFVWTSLIGIILGSLSLGYWWGGKMADKNPNYKIFSVIILFVAILICLTALIKPIILNFFQLYLNDVRSNSIISTIILFSPASIMLGMVSPYAARWLRAIRGLSLSSGSLFHPICPSPSVYPESVRRRRRNL